MAFDAADFQAAFPEFAGVDSAVISFWIATATEISAIRETATMFLTAHLVVMDQTERDGGIAPLDDRGGLIAEETMGPRKLAYMVQAETAPETFYARSYYGRMFMALERRATAMSIRVYQ